MADDDPSTFAIPHSPTRRYPRRGGVEYEGGTVFILTPSTDFSDNTLGAVLKDVLSEDPYRYGDWFDLPMPLYLVHDDDTRDTFRVAIRDGHIEFHVLPNTGSPGLRALYDRLVAATETTWTVERHTN